MGGKESGLKKYTAIEKKAKLEPFIIARTRKF